MIESYYKAPHTLQQFRISPSAPFLDGFTEHLENRGYTYHTIRHYLKAVSCMDQYLERKKLSLSNFNYEKFKAFKEDLNIRRKTNTNTVAGAKRFLEYLGIRGYLDVSSLAKPEPLEHELITKYKSWLKNQRGLSDSTLRNYSVGVRALIDVLGSDVSKYDARNLRGFLIDHCEKVGRGSVGILIPGLRMFLRYLIAEGKCRTGLEWAIPAQAKCRYKGLPSYLSASEIEKIIDTCEPNSLIGIRDKAILLFFARMGLRGSDVADLRFSQIDWDKGSIRFSGKARREEHLPLTQEIGDALVAYLERRPRIGEDRIFLCINAPFRPFGRGSNIARIVTTRMHAAGVKAARYGALILRHSVATQMLRKGVTLFEIGKVLRHKSVNMTAYYAKVDFELMKQVLQTWPEVREC